MPPVGDAGAEPELVAFVVSKHQSLDLRTLRAQLLRVLPRNMVPQAFIQLPSLPLSPNGKIDRRALVREQQLTVS
jgi:acyl-CoA synthetase (AMP-forming)/AMP-acid ligase II